VKQLAGNSYLAGTIFKSIKGMISGLQPLSRPEACAPSLERNCVVIFQQTIFSALRCEYSMFQLKEADLPIPKSGILLK
jgi:hypothetical protein